MSLASASSEASAPSAGEGLARIQFGVAEAPAQVEDGLNDIWEEWGSKSRIAGYQEAPLASERVGFWSNPDRELDLAAELKIKVYRLGVDWGRIMPAPHVFDQAVIERYRTILKKIHSRNMKVMLTLMHHSIPTWAQGEGGWLKDSMKDHYLEFSKRIMNEFQDQVEVWITFNEANVFVAFAYVAGLWPPGEVRSFMAFLDLGIWRGEGIRALDRMAESHNELYDWAHSKYPNVKMGLAHNMAYYTGKKGMDRIKAGFVSRVMNWRFPEKTRGHLDFFGMNYYGAEWLKGSLVDVDPDEEYSEAGRAIYPEGLHSLLKEIHKRFSLPVWITENGIADDTDVLRPAYLIEHLRAIDAAIQDGVRVDGYVVWSLSDNLEWSDGYCPKFGLVSVNRADHLKRTPRPSFYLYQKIIREGRVSEADRESAWNQVVAHRGLPRPFCRAPNGVEAYAKPHERPFSNRDWRFVAPVNDP